MRDVAVVGGGPAGAAAAIVCARAGLTVTVLERHADGHDKPGETLHPGVEPLLDGLGAGDRLRVAGFLRHAGIEVAWNAPPRFAPYGADGAGPWRGFQAWRASFDRLLLDCAAASGAEVRRGVRVCRALRADADTVVLETDAGAIAARWIVDAAGSGHWLARRLGLPIERLTPRLLCWYGYDRSEAAGPPRLSADDQGWTWVAEVRPRLLQWTRLSFDGSRPARPPVAGDVVRRARAADVTWRWVPACAGPGWMLTGDAAAVLDPTSGRGVLRALMTGMKAAHVIRASRQSARLREPACREYRRWLGTWVRSDAREMRRLYARLPRPPAWASAV